MALSNDLISTFVKVTQDKEQTKKESTAYGKIVKKDDVTYVQLDGSDLLTPISTTAVVNDGDRVLVSIKNHAAIVTGNLTDPSASDSEVKDIGNTISEFEIVIAGKVSTEQLEAEIAKIDKVIADNVTATNAKFETIEGKVAEIDTIKSDMIEVSGKITANEADITTLTSDFATFKDVTTNEITAMEGNFNNLNSDYATFKETTTNTLTANEASITELQTNKLDTETANVKYATIDFSNIGEAAIEKLFSDSGIIKDLIMNDGKVTGELVGVTIKGDLIEGNTVKADKLVIQGEDGLYYKLNVNSLGETTASSDEKYQNGLDGSVIIAESITAEKIAVEDLVAFGATIGGYHIDTNSLYSGTKNALDNTTRGVFLGDDGQINIGDSDNYLKFFVDTDGVYKLEIQANSIKLGSEDTSVEDSINALDNRTSLLEIESDSISASVSEIKSKQQSTESSIGEINNNLNSISKAVSATMTSEEIDIAIKTEVANGTTKVVTNTGFIFDDEGLTISKTGSEMTTNIDEDGMSVYKDEEEVLTADNEGVKAYNLHAKTYLIIGENSRFEDYVKDGKPRTGCFWIGPTEVSE